MTRLAFLASGLALVASACTTSNDNRLPAPAEALFQGAKSMELFALDPLHVSMNPANGRETFHDYVVLGRTLLSDRAKCEKLAGLVLEGIRESEGMVAACFDPRHGIRVQADSRTLDLVICFECLQVQVHDGAPGAEGSKTTVLTSNDVEPAITTLFEGVGLTIAGH